MAQAELQSTIHRGGLTTAKLMAELGWTAVRVRDLTRGGYKEQVRGYVRDARPSHNPN